MARALMFQGTGSSVGKSTIVAGLARALTLRGLRVRPFKPQNMSNNAAVTPEGGEIGRAQALQARACRIPPSVHMNPILLKPQSETGSQIIVQGRMTGTARARDYQAMKPSLLPAILDSFAQMQTDADIVLIEGAGSASEINLRANDIANMGFARATDTPVVLIGDIDRGGVIASLVGTRSVLDPADAALITGFIVNRMRGDPTLFADGMRAIADRTGWRPLGLVPHFPQVRNLPAEDAADLAPVSRPDPAAKLKIAVPLLPWIANFDDLDPLRGEPDVDLRLIASGTPIPADTTLVILPGSKATIADLASLRAEGWDIDIIAHYRRGGTILGLCGGYQMLGRTVADPDGIEGPAGTVSGLGLLAVDTILTDDKHLTEITGRLFNDDARVTGFEMHIGRTTGPDRARPMLHRGDDTPDGAQSPDFRVGGTYIHGIFAAESARAALLRRYGARPAVRHFEAEIEATLDALAAHLERHIDIGTLLTLAR